MTIAQKTLTSIQFQIEEESLIDWYQDAVRAVLDVIRLYETNVLTDESGIFVNNSEYRQFINNIKENSALQKAVTNIFLLMTGDAMNILKQESIFSLQDGSIKKYCRPEVLDHLMLLAAEGMKFILFAKTSRNNKPIDHYVKSRIKSYEAYLENCGCPKGYQSRRIPDISGLIPNLPPTTDPENMSLMDLLINARTSQEREKARMLLEYKNYKPSRDAILKIDKFTRDEIRRAIEYTKRNNSNWLEYFDGTLSCIQQNEVNFRACRIKSRQKLPCKFPFNDKMACDEKGTCSSNEICEPYGCYRFPCPKGYELIKGTTLSNRKVSLGKDFFLVKRDECANLCTQRKDCKSFEHCKSRYECGLFDVDLPKTVDNCVKVNGTKVCTNFCVLNEKTTPTGREVSEQQVAYDRCKQDGSEVIDMEGYWKTSASILSCNKESAYVLMCNGKRVRILSNNVLKMQSRQDTGRYDENNQIIWSNGEKWIKHDIEFVKACTEGACICEGYPNKEHKVELLKGGVTLQQCKTACREKRSCTGFEYWPNTNATNCFECGNKPGRTIKNTIVMIRFNKPLSKTSWASVYQRRLGNVTNRYIP